MASQDQINDGESRTFPRPSEFMVRDISVGQMLKIKSVWQTMTAEEISELGFDPVAYGVTREESVRLLEPI